jgi:pimeloyl-ACP methyl ester carboxylesterase
MPVIKVGDSHTAYTQAGHGGRAVAFLHGNRTSSYLWRRACTWLSPLASPP